MKRLILNLMICCLLLTAFAPAAYATETTETAAAVIFGNPSGTCGDNLTWTLEDGTLTISGEGEMADGAPWSAYKDSITSVVFTGGVTTVAAEAFKDYDKLTSVDFGGSMREINDRAFQSCEGLTSITLPATFRRFGPECFQGCMNLAKVYCAGSMPSFNSNCLWTYNPITVYYPESNPWPLKYIEELETNFGGRLEILCEDGTDPYVPTEPEETEETTEATTEPTEETVTEPETQPTEAATEPTVIPTETTPAETVPETTVPMETEAEETKSSSGIWIGVLIISGTLTLLLVGALIFRGRSKGGKYAA